MNKQTNKYINRLINVLRNHSHKKRFDFEEIYKMHLKE